MTPQSSFMVLAPVLPENMGTIHQLLESMNVAPGRVDRKNPLIPFEVFETLHMARLLILDDPTTGDVRVHGINLRSYPVYLAFLGDIDGFEKDFLRELADRAPDGLRTLFACCEGFDKETDLVDWMLAHRQPPMANYVNTKGRTVRQVREEVTLKSALDDYIRCHEDSLQSSSAEQVHSRLRQFVQEEIDNGRLVLSPEERTPFTWWIRDKLHLIGIPLVGLLLSPLLLLLTPVYLVLLRRLEKTDPEVVPPTKQEHSERLSQLEDHDVSNQFSAMGSLKPGIIRLATTIGVLLVVDYAARHLVRPGRLGRIRTIHFARWVFLDGTKRMIFCSNYDGSVESYMDDFINKAGFGLNASFSNGIGYPTTNWLIQDGCKHERKYKDYLRRHTLPTQVWYKAFPGLTAIDMERNTRIRKGLETEAMNEQEAREWAALL